MEFNEMVLKRQSCRNYDSSKKVSLDNLVEICNVSTLAPSACNSQPWKFHIVSETSDKLLDLRKTLTAFGMNKFVNNVNNFILIEQIAGNASVVLGSKMYKNDFNSIDIGIVASHICFSALQHNLSTCMIGAFKKENINKVMGFKDDCVIRLVIAIGYASNDDKLREKVRKDNKKIIEIH